MAPFTLGRLVLIMVATAAVLDFTVVAAPTPVSFFLRLCLNRRVCGRFLMAYSSTEAVGTLHAMRRRMILGL